MQVERILKANCHSCFTVSVQEQGEYLCCSSSEGGALKLYQLATAGCDLLPTVGKTATCTIFSPLGELLCCGFTDGAMRLYHTDGAEFVQELKGHAGRITAVAFDFRGRVLCSASHDGTLRCWRVMDGKCSATLHCPEKYPECCAFHGKRTNILCSGGHDGAIFVWDIEKQKALVKLKGHTRPVKKVLFHPVAPHLLCSSATDGTLRVWNWDTRECVQLIDGQLGPLLSFSILPNTGHLLVACRDEKFEEEEEEKAKKASTPVGMIASFVSFIASGSGGGMLEDKRELSGVDLILVSFDQETGLYSKAMCRACLPKGHNDQVHTGFLTNSCDLVGTASGERVCMWEIQYKVIFNEQGADGPAGLHDIAINIDGPAAAAAAAAADAAAGGEDQEFRPCRQHDGHPTGPAAKDPETARRLEAKLLKPPTQPPAGIRPAAAAGVGVAAGSSEVSGSIGDDEFRVSSSLGWARCKPQEPGSGVVAIPLRGRDPRSNKAWSGTVRVGADSDASRSPSPNSTASTRSAH